jgi:hypothetical protein
MASTFSPLLKIELIGIGDQNNTWGTTTNTNLGTLIEDAIAGSAAVNVTSGNVTLTDFDGSADQARCAALRITGTPGVSRNVIAPARSKIYVVANGSDAAIVLKTSTSTGLTVPTGEIYLAYFDTILLDFKLVGRASSSINTANTLVLRDGSGSFGANIVAANTFSGDLNGTINTLTTAVTQTAGNNSTKVATTAYVNSAVTTATAALGTMSTQNANAVAITGGTISGLSSALPVASGGTGVTTSTGSGAVVLGTSPTLSSPTLTSPDLGTPSAVVLTNASGTANSLNAGIGVNQSWQTPSRSAGTLYTNNTGKPIQVCIILNATAPGGQDFGGEFYVNGVLIAKQVNYGTNAGYKTTLTAIVPAGSTYQMNFTRNASIDSWRELS